MNKPHRAWEIEIKAGADTVEDLYYIVKNYMDELMIHKQPITSTSGGPSNNAIVTARIDETMTHERYFDQLHAYLDDVERARLEKLSKGTQ